MNSYLLVIAGLILLVKGADYLVDGASSLAKRFKIPDLVIGLTVVAFGTSAPELIINILASLQGNTEIAVGNIVGSNIFNIFFILGASAIISPLPFDPINNIDMIMTIGASFLLFLAMFIGKKHILEKWQGICFIIIYFGYLSFLVSRG
ncbi:MAG: hypothetical protein Q8N37_03115 [bacterium]|nr:hypothetical protein [bacterium]